MTLVLWAVGNAQMVLFMAYFCPEAGSGSGSYYINDFFDTQTMSMMQMICFIVNELYHSRSLEFMLERYHSFRGVESCTFLMNSRKERVERIIQICSIIMTY